MSAEDNVVTKRTMDLNDYTYIANIAESGYILIDIGER